MSNPMDELQSALVHSMGSQEKVDELYNLLINSAIMYHQGAITQDMLDELATKSLAWWISKLGPDQLERIESKLHVDIEVKGIFLDAIKAARSRGDGRISA